MALSRTPGGEAPARSPASRGRDGPVLWAHSFSCAAGRAAGSVLTGPPRMDPSATRALRRIGYRGESPRRARASFVARRAGCALPTVRAWPVSTLSGRRTDIGQPIGKTRDRMETRHDRRLRQGAMTLQNAPPRWAISWSSVQSVSPRADASHTYSASAPRSRAWMARASAAAAPFGPIVTIA